LQGYDISQNPLFMQCGLSAGAFLIFLRQWVAENRLNAQNIRASLPADPFALMARYGLLFEEQALYDEMAASLKYAEKYLPQVKTIGVDTSYLHNGGASVVQELAFALAAAADYIRALSHRDISVKDIAGKIHFSFSLASDFYLNAAKLRAMRLLWGNLIKAFGADGDIMIHCRTSEGETITAEPYNNLIRFTMQAVSAALGGCDAFSAGDFRSGDEFTRRMARNISLILQWEAKGPGLAGPLDGSYFLENLTMQTAEKAWTLFQDIEKEGGYYQALSKGIIQRAAAETAGKRKERLRENRDKIIGLNVYRKENADAPGQGERQKTEIKFKSNMGRKSFNDLNELAAKLKEGKNLWEIYRQTGSSNFKKIEAVLPMDIEKIINGN
jgi:methylmalonyl-CoA mutase